DLQPCHGLNGRRYPLPLGLRLPAFRDVVALGDFDTPALCGLHDLLASCLLLGAGLEVGLVETSHGVTDVGLVVDREVALALLVDVRELALVHLFPVFGVELSHNGPPSLFFPRTAAHTVPTERSPEPDRRRRRDRNPLYATGTPGLRPVPHRAGALGHPVGPRSTGRTRVKQPM